MPPPPRHANRHGRAQNLERGQTFKVQTAQPRTWTLRLPVLHRHRPRWPVPLLSRRRGRLVEAEVAFPALPSAPLGACGIANMTAASRRKGSRPAPVMVVSEAARERETFKFVAWRMFCPYSQQFVY